MTPDQIDLVQTTFRHVLPIRIQAGRLFYDRLFTLDPSLRPLFPADLTEQIGKLTTMIGVAVNGLRQLDSIVPAVQELGRRHAGYGVTAAHYDTVGQALIWTLEQGLGAAFTAEARAAWTACYGLLARTMQDAAARPAA